MATPLLSVRDLSASADDKPILHGVNLDVEPGTCHVLMGPNGAGKSTLGHVIMGDPASVSYTHLTLPTIRLV